jgi:hypothetical protein
MDLNPTLCIANPSISWKDLDAVIAEADRVVCADRALVLEAKRPGRRPGVLWCSSRSQVSIVAATTRREIRRSSDSLKSRYYIVGWGCGRSRFR